MNASDLITIDPEILGGAPVFKGTRVPVKTLFEYLENDCARYEIVGDTTDEREAAVICRIKETGKLLFITTYALE